HDQFSEGLRKSLYNYMHGIGLDFPLQTFFDFKIPKPTHPKNLIASFLQKPEKHDAEKPTYRVLWIGNSPELQTLNNRNVKVLFYEKRELLALKTTTIIGEWWMSIFPKISLESREIFTLSQMKQDFEKTVGEDFYGFLESPFWRELRKSSLLLLHY
ncbi:MAG: radical SAM protein, partial [Flammeovirgaceae bacterium]|nr:radical SAM protein [Flammeovirgaceae bacterium]MDW8286758.1 radical SAM protein [Flammeovirgaceae bacterium]